VNDTADIGRHVLIVTATGSFTVAGRRMSEPVDAADKLGKLIQWSRGKGGLQSIPVSNPDSEPAPARVWVVGGAVRLLARPSDDQTGDPADYLGRALAPLVDGGWELRGGPGASVVLAHGRGAQRVVVEVLAEQQPWLAGGDEAIADDAGELGRRLSRWYGALGVLPGPTGAVSGAVLADTMMAARTGRGRGAVVSGPGLVPSWVIPEVRIQPAWCATADQVEREFQHCDELTCLTQDSPALASAGMLTFGYGTSEPLDASAAAVAASAPKRPFGMWLVDLPAADDLELPQGLPLPHPHMAADHRVQAWITTEDLDGLAKPIRDGGAGMTVEQLGVSEAIVWPQRARVLEAWAKRLREAREAFAGDAAMPILAGEPTPTQIARRLQLLADALRFPWKINAGVTAVDLMLQTRTKTWSPQEWRDVVFAPSTTAPPFGIGDVESDFEWSRVPTSEECQRRYVHAYDRGGSYVAGIAGLELPIGDPVHHPDGAPFDAKTPGYWLADIPESSDWQLPYVLNPRGLQFTGPKWVCTPTLERAVELGYQPQILEARLWPRHGRVLLGWYERFRDASAMLDIDDPDAQAARDQAKIIRTHGIGIIGSDEHLKGKPGYSPERRLHVLAKAKANIVYRLHKIGEKTGQWPLAVATDTVVYASDDPDPVTAWPGGPESFGRGFGQYKPEASGLLDDHLEYLNGRDYRGKRDLISAAEWRANLAKTIDADGNR